jgi:hypothetical protein
VHLSFGSRFRAYRFEREALEECRGHIRPPGRSTRSIEAIAARTSFE